MSTPTQKSTQCHNVSRRVKSSLSAKVNTKPWKNNKAGRLPRKAAKASPAFIRQELDGETIWTFPNGQIISVPVADQDLAIREGAMIDDDRALSLENWTHLHDKNPLPTPAQRAQGAVNLKGLRLQLLQSVEEGRLFVHPDVTLDECTNSEGELVMLDRLPDGRNVIVPPRFASIDPSPLIDATGDPYILDEAEEHEKAQMPTSRYVNFGTFETSLAISGSGNSVHQDVELEHSTAASTMVLNDAEEMKAAPVTKNLEEASSYQSFDEGYSTGNPAWDPFASDFFEDDDDEIMRLEQERLDHEIMLQTFHGSEDADGDIEMPDYVEPEAEQEAEYCQETENMAVSEETRIDNPLHSTWYQAHLKARAAGSVRQYTATTAAEVNYLIQAPDSPAAELGSYVQGEKYDPFQIYKAVGADPYNGMPVMAACESDTTRRYALLLCAAGHLRECYDIHMEGDRAWPINQNGEALTGCKVPWVSSSMIKDLGDDTQYRLSYPLGARGRVKNEALDTDSYRESSKIRNFSKMRDIWTIQDDLIEEESWPKDNYRCWKSEEDRRRFPKLQFGTEFVTPVDPPEVNETSRAQQFNFEKIPVREFGYSATITVPIKYQFGDFAAPRTDESANEFEALSTTVLVPASDDLANFTVTGPSVPISGSADVDAHARVDGEAEKEFVIEEEFIIEDSASVAPIVIDNNMCLSDAEEGVTDLLAQMARDSSPFQDVPDEDYSSNALGSPVADICCSDKSKDEVSRGDTLGYDSANHREDLSAKVIFQEGAVQASLPEHVPVVSIDGKVCDIYRDKDKCSKVASFSPQSRCPG
ncbi:hypothetical protein FKW77_009227 [Venturia effusa]|uniref:Uncharacterized protein n=1 Tax=Venturia effusa TaxID=50376 RepID=A0A517LD02_9PEZI|nr:hypothetical protein FKW77_009227 [Venturia effusa]